MIYNQQDIRNTLQSLLIARPDFEEALTVVAFAFGVENIEGMTPLNEVIDGECALLAEGPSA